MKRLLLLLSMLCLSAAWVFAQTDTGNQTDTSTPSAQTQTAPDQSAAPADQQAPAATDQNAAPADQNAPAGQSEKSEKGNLPQTASPLPLLGLLGVGGLAGGLVARKRRKA